jgi:hypothetical protein
MALSYTIDDEARLVSLQYEGTVTFRAFADTMAAVFADSRHQPGFSFLADRRRAAAPSTEYARLVIRFLEQHADAFGTSRWGAVVASPAAYGMIRMIESRTDRLPIEIGDFSDPVEALAWLSAGPQGPA